LNASLGEFRRAAELLKSQLAVTKFENLKQFFVDAYTLNKAKVQTLPHGQYLDITLKQSASLPIFAVTI